MGPTNTEMICQICLLAWLKSKQLLSVSPVLFQPGILPVGNICGSYFLDSLAPARRELRPRGAQVFSNLLYGMNSACADINQLVLQNEGNQIAWQAGVAAFEIEILQKSTAYEGLDGNNT